MSMFDIDSAPSLSPYWPPRMDEEWFLERLKEWGLVKLVCAFFKDPKPGALSRLSRYGKEILKEAREKADVYWELYQGVRKYYNNPPKKLSRGESEAIRAFLGKLLMAMGSYAQDLDDKDVRAKVVRRLNSIERGNTESYERSCAWEGYLSLLEQWGKEDEALVDQAIEKLRESRSWVDYSLVRSLIQLNRTDDKVVLAILEALPRLSRGCCERVVDDFLQVVPADDPRVLSWLRTEADGWGAYSLVRRLIELNRTDDEVVLAILEALPRLPEASCGEVLEAFLQVVPADDPRVLSWLRSRLKEEFTEMTDVVLATILCNELGDEELVHSLFERLRNFVSHQDSVDNRYLLKRLEKCFTTSPEGRRRWADFLMSLARHGYCLLAYKALADLACMMVEANEDVTNIMEFLLTEAENHPWKTDRAEAALAAVRILLDLKHKQAPASHIIAHLVGDKVTAVETQGQPKELLKTPLDYASISAPLQALLERYGLVYRPEDLERYHNALWANVGTGSHRHFVILAGPSGTGKTKMAQLYAAALLGCSDLQQLNHSRQFKLVPVRPEWTDARDIMGYYNPLAKEADDEYIATSVLELILEANNNKGIPFFLVLDEMNLAHVEYYFSYVQRYCIRWVH